MATIFPEVPIWMILLYILSFFCITTDDDMYTYDRSAPVAGTDNIIEVFMLAGPDLYNL